MQQFPYRGCHTGCCHLNHGAALQDKLRALFEAEGFRCNMVTVREKTVENRALDLRMPRRWIQAVFTHVGSPNALVCAASVTNGNSTAQPAAVMGSPYSDTLSDRASAASGQHVSAEATETVGSQEGAVPTGAAAADAACPPDDGCGDSGAHDEWDAPPEEGVLGSDVGGLFQQPLEMVHEAITLAPGFTIKASTALPCSSVIMACCPFRLGSCNWHLDRSDVHWSHGAHPFNQAFYCAPYRQVSTVARDHKNTVGHTGLMLWEAALPLARFILACPSLFRCECPAGLADVFTSLCCSNAHFGWEDDTC